MKKISNFWRKENFWLFLCFGIAAFLRLYKLSEWQFFTYDRARDYLIVKKIILDQKFTLVGPTVLAPGVFLPPFYYYSLIFPLWLSNFHLIGPDIYTALLGIFAVVIFFLLVKDLFGKEPAILSSLVFSLNPYLIQASRHAWNPNTIYLFSTIFALSFERFFLKKKSYYLIFASFSFSWALNLHYTVIVFLPILIFLFYKEVKRNLLSRYFWVSLATFLFLVFPIVLFEFRHNFPNLKGVFGFITNQVGYGERMKLMLVDYIKMPLVLLFGLNQNQNLSVNIFHTLLFDKVSLLLEIKTVIGLMAIVGVAFFFIIRARENLGRKPEDEAIMYSRRRRAQSVTNATGVSPCVFINGVRKKSKSFNILLLFLFFGFTIRLVFPPTSFYFYHYTFFFPFIFLLLGFIFAKIVKQNKNLAIVLAIFMSALPLYGSSLKNEVKNEKYFLPSVKVIAQDAGREKVAVAANLSDIARWDHNGLEYRYFLESVYKFPLAGWEAGDYKSANVLYLIDEGELKDPLKLGGMEMEAFKPVKIEKVWEIETGQKVYKMTK